MHRQQHAGDGWRNYQPGKTRQERGYGRPWEIKRARIMKRDKYLCQNCRRDGIATKASSVDHIIPKAHGGKATSGYERSHRIDLPQAGSTWTLRLRKITPDANSVKVGDVMTLQSYTEVIDAKLRYCLRGTVAP